MGELSISDEDLAALELKILKFIQSYSQGEQNRQVPVTIVIREAGVDPQLVALALQRLSARREVRRSNIRFTAGRYLLLTPAGKARLEAK